MIAEPWLHIPVYASLLVVAVILGLALGASLILRRAKKAD